MTTEAETRLVGVYRTVEPVAYASDSTPCHNLLRFYPDGLVLHASLCADVDARWSEITAWFNREASATEDGYGTGVGTYTIHQDLVRFNTVTFDRETRSRVELEHHGALETDRVRVRTRLVGDPRDVELVYVRLSWAPA